MQSMRLRAIAIAAWFAAATTSGCGAQVVDEEPIVDENSFETRRVPDMLKLARSTGEVKKSSRPFGARQLAPREEERRAEEATLITETLRDLAGCRAAREVALGISGS